jgi:hypothetical protein
MVECGVADYRNTNYEICVSYKPGVTRVQIHVQRVYVMTLSIAKIIHRRWLINEHAGLAKLFQQKYYWKILAHYHSGLSKTYIFWFGIKTEPRELVYRTDH